MPFYHISQPNEFLCKTGVGIDDVLVVKKCFQLPGQSVVRFSISPHSYSLEIQAMSLEKLEFRLPAVFTVGAKDSPEALCKYARLLTTNQRNVAELVKGIVEGEMRVICAGLTIEEIFKDRQLFKDRALGSIDKELSVFGIKNLIRIDYLQCQHQANHGCSWFRVFQVHARKSSGGCS